VKAVIESSGGVASHARLGEHELVFDQPTDVPGGEDRGPSPLDVMAVAVAACAHYYAAAFLFGRQLATTGLRVEVEFDKARDPVPRLGKLLIHVFVPSHVPLHYQVAIERAIRRCPAYGTLTHPPEVVLSVRAVPLSSAPAA